MENLFSLPEVQSGIIPFGMTIIVALVLRPLGWHWSGIALAGGFYASAYVMGILQLEPTRSTNKVLLLGLIAVASGLVFDLLARNVDAPDKPAAGFLRWQQSLGRVGLIVALLAGMAALWLIWPVINRQQGIAFFTMGIGVFCYAAWLVLMLLALRGEPLRAASAAWVLAFSTAVCVILGASALLGQLAISLGASAGAFCLLAIFSPALRGGALFVLPAAVLAAMIAIAGVIFAKTPWYSLILLALIPLLVRLPVPNAWPRQGQVVLLAVYALPGGVAAALPVWWQSASDTAYY